jgi:tape measure domain-containing protein
VAEGFKILDAYVEVHADARGVAREAAGQIDRESVHLNKAGSSLGGALMGGLQSTAMGAVAGVTAAITGTLTKGIGVALDATMSTLKGAVIDYNSTLEQANIGFTTMLGSAEKAKSFLGDLQKFAASTPFEFTDLTRASQRLIAMGIAAKDVVPTMTAIGDAVAGLGGGAELIDQVTLAIGQMTAKGKVQGDDLMQLTEAGIPALKILADSYGTTTSEMSDMISEGKILSGQAVPAIVRGLEQGTKSTQAFGGMMAKQSKTLQGSLSNIQDSLNQTLGNAFQPFFRTISKGAGELAKFTSSKGFQKWVGDIAKAVQDVGGMIGNAYKQLFADPEVRQSVVDLGNKFKVAYEQFYDALKKVLPNFITYAKEVLPAIITNVGKILEYLPVFLDLWVRVSGTFKDMAPRISGVLGFLGDAVGFVAGLASAVQQLNNALSNTGAYASSGGFSSGGGGAFGNNPTGPLKAGVGARSSLGAVFRGGSGSVPKISMPKMPTLSAAGGSGGGSGGGGSKADGPTLREIFEDFRKYGRQVAAGLKKGLLGDAGDVRDAAKDLREAIREAFDEKKISKSAETGMLAQVKTVTDRLVAQAKRREDVIDRLKKAKDKLAQLQDDRKAFSADIKSALFGNGDVSSLYEAAVTETTTQSAAAGRLDGRAYQASYTTSSTTTTLGGLAGVRAKLRTLVDSTKKFTANLKTLVKRGLDRTTVGQLLQAGPLVGLPITTELLNDKEGFNDLIDLQKQLNSAGSALGEFGAGYTYDSDIASTTAKIDRLRDRRDNITAVMVVEARKIDEVDKVVKAVNALAKTAKAKKAAKK